MELFIRPDKCSSYIEKSEPQQVRVNINVYKLLLLLTPSYFGVSPIFVSVVLTCLLKTKTTTTKNCTAHQNPGFLIYFTSLKFPQTFKNLESVASKCTTSDL